MEDKLLKPLTDDQISEIFNKFDFNCIQIAGEHIDLFKFIRAIEKAHGIQ